MTDNEVIDQILYKMEPDKWHGYFNLWREITKATLADTRFAVMDDSIADKTLKKMWKRNLVEIKYSGDQTVQYALIKLADRALKLRDNETWVNNVKRGILSGKPKISIWKILERGVIVATLILFIYFIYDRYFSNNDKSGQKPESTTTEKPDSTNSRTAPADSSKVK